MFETAFNPWYWGGAVAVSSPIIIHLINRLRYRRLRWAAMEFLLKSQQRNRRKLILEQLILLLLRCLLVLLVVALVVRPTWLLGDAAETADRPSYHFILIDDSLSMQDKMTPEGPERQTAFQEAIRRTVESARKTLESGKKHYATVVMLSEVIKPPEQRRPLLGKPFAEVEQQILRGELQDDEPPGQLLTDDEAQVLRNKLEGLESTYLRLGLRDGVEEAERYLKLREGAKFNRYLHIVSDFRRKDWLEGDSEKLCQLLGKLAHPHGSDIAVRLHDVAHPGRTGDRQQVPAAHNNLGWTNLRIDPRVTTPNARVRLTAEIQNFGDTERKAMRLAVKVDGQEKVEFDHMLDIGGGEKKNVDFDLLLDFTKEEDDRKVQKALRKVSLHITDKDHLPGDDVRYVFIELRREIPVLLVDPDSSPVGSDSFFVDVALTGTPKSGLRCRRIRPSDIRPGFNLDDYPVVFLLNVTGMGPGTAEVSPEGLKALENYVLRGGSVVFFLGPRVNVDSYNKDFYNTGKGIFPVPLVPRPDPSKPNQHFVDAPFTPDDLGLTPESEKPYPTVKFLKTGHQAFRIYEDRPDFLYFLAINRYFRVEPDWVPGEDVTKVLQVRNRLPLANYRQRALDLVGELNRDRSPFANALRNHLLPIQTAVGNTAAEAAKKGTHKGAILSALEALLGDAALVDYYRTEGQELRRKVEDLHKALDTGDPIIIEAAVGSGKVKGHMMAFLTSAGPTRIEARDYTWNNWAELFDPNGFTPYPVMMLLLHKHMAELRLAGQAETDQRMGGDFEVRLDKERYDPQLLVMHWKDGQEFQREEVKNFRELAGELVASIKAPVLPGHYLLRLNPPPSTKGETEDRPVAFNVDARDEGALGRVTAAQLDERLAAALSKTPELNLDTEKSREFAQGREWFWFKDDWGTSLIETAKSWSDYWWVLVLFLVFLLLEQWLAMKFSHHLRGGQAQLPAQVRRPQAPVVAPPATQEVTA